MSSPRAKKIRLNSGSTLHTGTFHVNGGLQKPYDTKEKIQQMISEKNENTLASMLLSLSDDQDGVLTSDEIDVWKQASMLVTNTAHEGMLNTIANEDREKGYFDALFTQRCLPIECVIKITNYLEMKDKVRLCELNKSWKQLSEAYYMWESLDPFPVLSFSSYNSIKSYFSLHKRRFLGTRLVQIPRIPTSFKFFQDLFETMPLMNAISLCNIAGCKALRHCILQCPTPSLMVQLSIGLSTRLTCSEVSYALKCFGEFLDFICD